MSSSDLVPYNVAYAFCAVVLVIVLVYRLRALVDSRTESMISRGVWAVDIAFGSTAIAFTLATPAVYLRLDKVAGIPNVATLGVYLGIVVSMACLQVVMIFWIHSWHEAGTKPRVFWWVMSYLASALAMIVLFAIGAAGPQEHPVDFDATYAATPWISEFLLIYYTAYAVAIAGLALSSRRLSRSVGGWLGRGLRWICCGANIALGYGLLKAVAVLAILAGLPGQDLSSVWAPLFAAVGALIMATGLAMPACAPRAAAWIRKFRAYGQLHPLWRAMTRTAPELILDRRPTLMAWSGRWAIRAQIFYFFLHVVQVLAGAYALRHFLELDAAEAVVPAGDVGQNPSRSTATREAVRLAEAVRSRSAGKPPGAPAIHPIVSQHEPRFADEVAWLVMVSKEFRRIRTGAVRAEEVVRRPDRRRDRHLWR